MNGLNHEQQAVVEQLIHFVTTNQEAPATTVVGPGGSGKTYLIMRAVHQMLDAGLKVLFTAPTNKAVKQLEKAAREYGLPMDNVAFQTTHSALGLAMMPSDERKFTVRAGKGVVRLFDVVVADECGMLGRVICHKYLFPELIEHGVSGIMMGDDFQLPPIGEESSPTFTDFGKFTLAKVERQKPGPLLDLNTALREAIAANKPFKAKAPDANQEQLKVIKAAQFLKQVVADFSIDTDLDSQRVLAWSNRRVNEINAAIRKKLFSKEAPAFVEGERVVTGGPIFGGPDEPPLLGTDEECLVHHVAEDYLVDDNTGQQFKTLRLVLNPIHAPVGQVIVHTLHPDALDQYQETKDRLGERARQADDRDRRRYWAQFWAFCELFADIRHCYCITVHRAQGSTFDRVYADVKDILRNTKRFERQRLLYVAYSRPRSQLLTNKSTYVA